MPGNESMLVAREARAEGRYRRSFEQLALASLAPLHTAERPAALAAFRRWQDPGWAATTLSQR